MTKVQEAEEAIAAVFSEEEKSSKRMWDRHEEIMQLAGQAEKEHLHKPCRA